MPQATPKSWLLLSNMAKGYDGGMQEHPHPTPMSSNEALGRNPRAPLTVSQLTLRVKGQLEQHFPKVWLVGEITNFKAAASGHWYFSLKDEQAQIRVNMWRSFSQRIKFRPKDGMEVLLRGGLNVYAPRGEYALIADQMEEVGIGRLRAEFERLKEKLRQEGLFDADHKKGLPYLPRRIGIVTSPTGAAVRDILRVLSERFRHVEKLICPARVQGQGAAEEIAEAIRLLDQTGHCDLIIVGRGGGSEEDLWCFNEEVVARAIFAAKTPIISAVGHEVDFTISDFVADIRAATPSNAAEIAVQTESTYRNNIAMLSKHMEKAMNRRLLFLRSRVKVSENHPIFIKVRSRLNDLQRRLVDADNQLKRRIENKLRQTSLRLIRLGHSLDTTRLYRRIDQYRVRLTQANTSVAQSLELRFNSRRQLLGMLISRLEDLSPLRILSRGYAVVFTKKNRIARSKQDLSFGDVIRIQFAQDHIKARVLEDFNASQPSLFDP